ncbi:MAG: DNA-directed RNA polymerase subunit alpha [Erysipelotrichaceae bacterium]|nr:DNA-directed RNA polymerase subunit alpha [Erysipelotrichaceae bacterium]
MEKNKQEKYIENPFEDIDFKVAAKSEKRNYGKFNVSPLEGGFGITIGNALRRVLLNSLPGAAVFAVQIEGADHEFSALEGVVEDVTTIILNLKDLVLKIEDDEDVTKRLEIDLVGPAVVRASDIRIPSDVKVINPELEIAHIAEGGHLKMVLYARNSRGYETSEANKQLNTSLPVGSIATDSLYSPIKNVAYHVDGARVGHDSRFDSLSIEVTTNGSITPQEAIALAAQILVAHFQRFTELDSIVQNLNVFKEDDGSEEPGPFDNMTIEELDLSVRSYNCLKRYGFQMVLELTEKTEEEMTKIRNMGKKSLKEVKDTLAEYGLSFRES